MSAIDLLLWVALIIGVILYGLFWLIVWALPFVLLIGGLVLAAMFIRKLVLDAVREARKDSQ